MPEVRKANRVITVPEAAVDSYLKEGYDQIDETGKVVKQATGGKSVSLVEYNKVVEELKKLKAKEKPKKKGD